MLTTSSNCEWADLVLIRLFSGPRPEIWCGSSSGDAEREFQPEARVGVIESVAEQLTQAREPVTSRLRVDPEALGSRAEPSLFFQPDSQRRRQALSRSG